MFLYPEILWLAPLVAAPILIHLLSRLRYRRVRWAAIEFLLKSERRAVRRARLQQILLMVLRTLLLAFALLALAQPVLRGGIGRLLGGETRLVALLDASASMAGSGATGSAFDRAKESLARALDTLPRDARAMLGVFSARCEMPFREPMSDLDSVAQLARSSRITSGAGDIPGAIRAAAEALGRSGGGGVIWVLTDGRAMDWRADDGGSWQAVRQALVEADRPRIVVSDLSPQVSRNFYVESVRLSPSVPIADDAPRLTATVVMRGEGKGATTASLFLDDRRIDARSVEFAEPGKSDCVFRLPPLTAGTHAGRIELTPDPMPADDRHYFAVAVESRIPVLLVDGAPSSQPFAGAAAFLALAAGPPDSAAPDRSGLSGKTVSLEQLERVALGDFAAVFLADVSTLTPPVRARLEEYVRAGGLLAIFPGARADAATWETSIFPGVGLGTPVEAPDAQGFRVAWVSPRDPLTASLPGEGLDRLRIRKLFPLDVADAQLLATTDDGKPFLLQRQVGMGRVLVHAVSAQLDFSNLPFTPILLLTMHRAVLQHVGERRGDLSRPAFSELRVSLRGVPGNVMTPDGRVAPLQPLEKEPDHALFDATDTAGIYRLTDARPGMPASPDGDDLGPIVAAINTPASESELDRIEPERIRQLLPGHSVVFLSGGGIEGMRSDDDVSTATAFPLALLALMCLIAAVTMAWWIGRPESVENKDRDAR